MRCSGRLLAGIAVAGMLTGAVAFAAEKEDPNKKKYNYPLIPVEATCLEGYHPTVDPQWGNVFPCIADAEIVAPTKPVAAVAAPVATP